MRALLFLVGFPTALLGAFMCLDVLWTGEGNPLIALGVLVVGCVMSAPGFAWAQTQDWR